MGKHLRLAMSAQAAEHLGDRLRAVVDMSDHHHSLEVVTIEDAIHLGQRDIDAAFISRDVTGTSTKHQVEPTLQACYDLLLANTGLQWVHIHSAGADRPVYVELHARGVAVTTSSGANAQVVAATALGGILALARRFPMLWAQQQQQQWKAILGPGRMPRDLPGQHAVILGWGAIGQELARLLLALRLHVSAIRTQSAPPEGAVQMSTYDDLHQVLPHADWLILACPLTARTRGLVDKAVLEALPQGAHLINVARGEVVDEPALIKALQHGHLGGAFLDVFAQEPLPPGSPLWNLPNVMVTPHGAGHSDGNEARVADLFLQNLGFWLREQPLLNRVR